MPELCRIGSTKIYMWTNDHGPAHIHVRHGRLKDKLYLDGLLFEHGNLQTNHQREVLKWARAAEANLSGLGVRPQPTKTPIPSRRWIRSIHHARTT